MANHVTCDKKNMLLIYNGGLLRKKLDGINKKSYLIKIIIYIKILIKTFSTIFKRWLWRYLKKYRQTQVHHQILSACIILWLIILSYVLYICVIMDADASCCRSGMIIDIKTIPIDNKNYMHKINLLSTAASRIILVLHAIFAIGHIFFLKLGITWWKVIRFYQIIYN